MAKKNNKKRRVPSSTTALLGAIMIVLGGFLSFYHLIEQKRSMAFNYMNTKLFQNEVVVQTDEQEETESQQTQEQQEQVTQEVTSGYIGYLEIPKINFNRGFYSIESPENTVEKNIQVISGSTMPNVSKGNLIIAGHSGTGWKAFFNDLYQLSVGDQAIVTYQSKRYTYQITSIYKESKTGTIAIKRDYSKTSLTLVTCTNYDNTTQTVYIANLVHVS